MPQAEVISFARIRLVVSRNIKVSHLQDKCSTVCRLDITVDEMKKRFRTNNSSATVMCNSSNIDRMFPATHKASTSPALSPTERG